MKKNEFVVGRRRFPVVPGLRGPDPAALRRPLRGLRPHPLHLAHPTGRQHIDPRQGRTKRNIHFITKFREKKREMLRICLFFSIVIFEIVKLRQKIL